MSNAPPPKWLMIATIAMGLIAAASATVWLTLRQPQTSPAGLPQERSGGPGTPAELDPSLARFNIPEFALVDQDGNAVDHTLFEGEHTVVSFVFTNCPFVCPGMTAAMARLQDELADTNARFVSISVDPERDTPEALRAFAERYGADGETWRFLTGDEAEMQKVAGSLGMVVQDDPSTPIELDDGSEMLNIIHPSRLLLIGPERQLLGLWTFNDRQALAELEATVRSLTGGR